MVEWIVSSSVLIAVLILLRFVLKGKISLRLQYALWAVVLVRLLVPVSFGDTAMSVGNLTQKAAASEPAQFVSALSETELPRMTYQAAYNEVAKEYADRGIQIEEMPLEEYAETVDYEIMNKMNGDLSIAEVVKIIWISGIVLVGIWFLLSNLRLYLSLKKIRTLLTDRHALPVYLSDAIDTPCLFGLFHPAIYLTNEAIESEHTQRHAVEHELTHFHHKDNIWAILRSVCLAVHWFNPLVWCAAVLSRNDAELACDESTILRLGEDERAAYGRTLIHLTCEKRPALLNTATTMTGSGKSIKERIALIVKKPKMAGYTLAAVILITVFAVGCTFTGASTPSEAPDESGTTSTGQYASMEDFAAAAMEKTTTVTYYTLYDPNTDPSSPREATATVQDTKIAWLEKKGEVSGLAPEGMLEAWTFNYLVKIDADPTTVSLVGGMYEEDGWFDLEGQGGHNIVALRYEDGSYDILYDAPVNDNYDFYGLRNSYEEAIYDWYVKKNNLDLPLYVKDWVDIITVPGGESLGDFPVHRYDGDGWYLYLPVQAWTTPFRNSAGNYEIYSQYDTGSHIIIGKNSANEEQTLAHYLDLGHEITEVGLVKQHDGETHCVYLYPANDGGCYVLHTFWYDEGITDYPYIAMEPDVMRLVAESFTVDARIVGLAPENAAEELAMVQALRDATMDNSTLTRIEENKEVDLVRSGATMDVLKSAAENLQVLEDPLELDAHIGAAYLWLGDPGDRHISFRAAKEPYQVKIRYVGDDVNESAVTNNPQLYLFLMAATEKENVELHDLDGDGLLEGIIWLFSGNQRNIVIYDVYDGALQRVDVNGVMECTFSDFTGLIANIHPDYNKMVQIEKNSGQVDVYQYHDGEFSYVCPLNDVIGYAPPRIEDNAPTAPPSETDIHNAIMASNRWTTKADALYPYRTEAHHIWGTKQNGNRCTVYALGYRTTYEWGNGQPKRIYPEQVGSMELVFEWDGSWKLTSFWMPAEDEDSIVSIRNRFPSDIAAIVLGGVDSDIYADLNMKCHNSALQYYATLPDLPPAKTFTPTDVNFSGKSLTSSPDEMTYEERLAWVQAGPDYSQTFTSLGRYAEGDRCIAYLGQWVGTPHMNQYSLSIRFVDGTTAYLPLPDDGAWGSVPPDTMSFQNGKFIYEMTFPSQEVTNEGETLVHIKGTYHYEVDLGAKTVSLTVVQ